MIYTFNIFVEERAEKKLCPHTEYLESKDSRDLVDWDRFDECEEINASLPDLEMINTSTVVIGYFRTENEESDGYFVKYIVADSKEKMYLQHCKDYDLIIFMTDHDTEGNPTEDKFKGVIKIDGRIEEQFVNRSTHDRKVWGSIAQQVLNRSDKGMRVFSMSFIEKKKVQRKTKKKSEKQPSAAN